jgi:hypothetical protein
LSIFSEYVRETLPMKPKHSTHRSVADRFSSAF